MPKTDIWMPITIGDYLKDTLELTAEEHGVYFLLLMHYWTKNGKIGSDLRKLSMVARSDIETTERILSDFFTIDGDHYINKRADAEMVKAKRRRVSASENGKKGGRPPKNNPQKTYRLSSGNPINNPQESSSSSSSSSESPTEPEEKKPRKRGFDLSFIVDEKWRDLWAEWIGAKPVPYKKAAGVVKGFAHLQSLSGGDIQKAKRIVDNAIAQGWQGLYLPHEMKNNHPERKKTTGGEINFNLPPGPGDEGWTE